MGNQNSDRGRDLVPKEAGATASTLVGAQIYEICMQNKNPKSASSSWGGARAGSGHKPKDHDKAYAFKSWSEIDAFLSTYEGNKTEFINRIIFTIAGQSPFPEGWVHIVRAASSWSLW